MSRRISRGTLLKGMAGLSLAALSAKVCSSGFTVERKIPCRLLGPSISAGHSLRGGYGGNEVASQRFRKEVVIVGGGMAGLSAAWWLKKQGHSDFVLLELEDYLGGNSTSGKNQVSRYPWGAHYVPVCNEESRYVQMLFEEIGVIVGYDSAGLPLYNDLYLCQEPQERLLKDGAFQEGMVPKRGLQPLDKEEIARFFDLMHGYRNKVGRDGKPAFAIPLDLSSQDEELLALDGKSMLAWLNENDFRSQPLNWYVNYCLRDDYGSTSDKVSAWAGIHYFAGRRGKAANAELNSVVTWPEGNGFIVSKLKEKLQDHTFTGALVCEITGADEQPTATYIERATGQRKAVQCDRLIFAAPRFVARHVIKGYEAAGRDGPTYAPWMVANITVKSIPRDRGVPLSWDNVDYSSRSLGYVVATHQNITTREGPTVITYYFPLSEGDPASARKRLLAASSDEWLQSIVADLEKMHPGIQEQILSVDLWPWGHGMIRPSPGFLWGDDRKRMKDPMGAIIFAHSDMSGMSNFEEAQYQGIEAAKQALARVRA